MQNGREKGAEERLVSEKKRRRKAVETWINVQRNATISCKTYKEVLVSERPQQYVRNRQAGPDKFWD